MPSARSVRLARRLHRPGAGLFARLREAWIVRVAEGRARRRRRARRGLDRARRQAADAAKSRLTTEAQAELAAFVASDERLVVAPSEAPDVSVVVAVWNQPHWLLRCVRALLADQVEGLELILVDNASGAGTQALLARIDGATVLRNDTNLGFLLACNQGGAVARGRVLLMLNSDAFVRPGAVAEALAALAGDPRIGAVGGRLIQPSGELQEAGSIVWADATTVGYGRGLAPDAPEVIRRREVDFCCGAFFATPRAVWEALGGFDPLFAPGYYEEVDYCMRLRTAGYRVVFEPSIVVDHFEFGSEAKAGDATAISARNRETFRARYADILAREHWPHTPANVAKARERLKSQP